jgi:hypothetical protein
VNGSVPSCAVSGLRWPVLPWASGSPPRSFDLEPPLSRWIETNGRAASADNRAVPTDAHSSGHCRRTSRARLAAVLMRVVPVSPVLHAPACLTGKLGRHPVARGGSNGCCHRARELSIATHALKSGGEANASDHRLHQSGREAVSVRLDDDPVGIPLVVHTRLRQVALAQSPWMGLRPAGGSVFQ